MNCSAILKMTDGTQAHLIGKTSSGYTVAANMGANGAASYTVVSPTGDTMLMEPREWGVFSQLNPSMQQSLYAAPQWSLDLASTIDYAMIGNDGKARSNYAHMFTTSSYWKDMGTNLALSSLGSVAGLAGRTVAVEGSGLGGAVAGSEIRVAGAVAAKGGGIPDNPTAYSVAFETKLNLADFGKSRPVHFNRANVALDNALTSDAAFADMLDELIPGVKSSVSSVGGRATPTGWTWEHASSSTASGQQGIMRLVPTTQHTPGSQWWRVLHPDSGAAGGYSEWAIPAGAPKNSLP